MKKSGIIFLTIGIISLAIQNIFFGYVDAEGFVHDSIFLPLGSIFSLIGISLLAWWGTAVLVRKF